MNVTEFKRELASEASGPKMPDSPLKCIELIENGEDAFDAVKTYKREGEFNDQTGLIPNDYLFEVFRDQRLDELIENTDNVYISKPSSEDSLETMMKGENASDLYSNQIVEDGNTLDFAYFIPNDPEDRENSLIDYHVFTLVSEVEGGDSSTVSDYHFAGIRQKQEIQEDLPEELITMGGTPCNPDFSLLYDFAENSLETVYDE